MRLPKGFQSKRSKARELLPSHFDPRFFPTKLKKFYLQPSVNRSQRFALELFLWGNGLPPSLIYKFMTSYFVWDDPQRQFPDIKRELREANLRWRNKIFFHIKSKKYLSSNDLQAKKVSLKNWFPRDPDRPNYSHHEPIPQIEWTPEGPFMAKQSKKIDWIPVYKS